MKKSVRLLSLTWTLAGVSLVAMCSPVQLATPETVVEASSPTATTLPTVSPDAAGEWQLIWNDEFELPGGVDPAKWQIDTGQSYPGGPANWGTGEVEWMSDSQANVFQSSGWLHLRALHSGSHPTTGWTSGRIETQRLDFQPPPRGAMAVEAALRLPDVSGNGAQGYWPAFWLLGAPFRGNYWNWPAIGEIDIMENVNGLNTWYGVFHCGVNPGGPCNETIGLGANAADFAPSLQAAFHTYRVELDRSASSQQIRWYVDGSLLHVVSEEMVGEAAWEAAIDHGFIIILNLALGGGWPGAPTATTTSGGSLQVDYVRVYYSGLRSVYLPMTLSYR